MGAMQRQKGKTGEREAAALIRDLAGWDVQRRVRQHGGDSDLVGVPGWSVEVKRRRSATQSDLATWWAQAVAQAGSDRPVLLYRLDRGAWRAVWSLAPLLAPSSEAAWKAYRWTANSSLEAWAAVACDRPPAAPVAHTHRIGNLARDPSP